MEATEGNDKVGESAGGIRYPVAIFGEGLTKVFEHTLLKGLVVGDNAASATDEPTERGKERRARVISSLGKELVVPDSTTGCLLNVQRERTGREYSGRGACHRTGVWRC